MPNKSSSVSLPNNLNNQTVSSLPANRSNFAPFSCLSSGIPTYCTPSSSTMSAAAAAAFLLQAATGGSVNGDGSTSTLPSRRTSTSNFLEAPQTSPSFPSSVISAAAHHAAMAAVQAIGSSQSPPCAKASSDLQAAVISLALAANPSPTHQSQAYAYDQNDRAPRPTHAAADFFFLSERHPELLTSHPTLASVFRRRSSTVLPTYLSDVPHVENSTESFDKPILGSDSASQTLVSALEALTSRHPNFSFSEPAVSPIGIGRRETSALDHNARSTDDDVIEFDPYRVTQGDRLKSGQLSTCDSSLSHSRKVFPAQSSSDRVGTRAYKELPCTLSLSMHLTSPSLIMRSSTNINNPCLSPTPTSSVNDGLTTHYRSSSPLSYSSPSNAATPGLNISPMPSEDRVRSSFFDVCNDTTTKSGLQTSSLRTGCLNSQEVKSEYSFMSDYKDEPNRKREQRLIKNREAARECRRKKKEYVKCLESRVSLLESQNQQLIEELQKVKALCFNELCGLGMNNPTAACAAAVLAAVTSIPGTSSVPGTFTSTALKYSSPQSGVRVSDHGFFSQSNLCSESDQPSSHMTPASRSRARRRSIFTTSKVPELSGSDPVDPQPSLYESQYTDAADRDDQSSRLVSHGEVTQKEGISQPCMTTQSCTIMESTSAGVTSTFCDTGLSSNETYRQRSRVFTPQAFSELPRSNSKRIEQTNYLLDSSASENRSSQSPTYFFHQHSATKRPYRNLLMQTAENQMQPDLACPGTSEYCSEPKSSRSSNSVAGAAVILAAAAAMVAKSESSSIEPRISV